MVYVRTYDAPPVRHREILRYAGVKESYPELEILMRECLAEIEGKLSYKVCYAEFPTILTDERVDLGFSEVCSADLAKNLSGCHSIILFAATVGIEFDRLIARYGYTSPSKALLFQAIGAERIEALCDLFCKEIRNEKNNEGFSTRPRFSAGYGDLPIEFQRDIFRALDCPRKIGLSLNESMLMTPSKSVTAVIGVYGAEQNNEEL